MLKGIVVAGVLIIGGFLMLHRALANGRVQHYLDTHRDPRWVPTTEYYIGKGYYLFQNLSDAATYFQRVPQQYPNSPRAEQAYFNYLQTLDDNMGSSRDTLIAEDQTFLEKYPNGPHASMIRDRIDNLRNSAH
jgi:TolA-binding protein